jgi:peptidoglycan hydrolase CwlO-like protein
MNRKFIVAILLVAALPAYVQAQNPRVSKGDAQKVATIISSDKIKTQAYCDIQKLAEQVAEANEKKDVGRVNELFEKIETLEKTIGPEYVALIDGVQDIAKNGQLRAEFLSAFGALARLCTR